LRRLGARHIAYGGRPEHYPLVGGVLSAAMAAIAGVAWTAEHQLAWNDTFELVAATMLERGEQAVLDAAA
jgi:methyl-accepting chemotaxis protein